ncbi:hypothetical protein VB636_01310, partial [Paracoccus sp. APAP_BH8]|uniref:hypothetical protein n=1 Tax=Paracoccus sp. APAP_BH8 TaxID=3110237 RepID=UPI002FD81772
MLLDEPLANLDYKLREELRIEIPRSRTASARAAARQAWPGLPLGAGWFCASAAMRPVLPTNGPQVICGPGENAGVARHAEAPPVEYQLALLPQD